MLDDIKAINAVMLLRQRVKDHVVDMGFERPPLVLARADIINEDRIEIIGDNSLHLLHHEASTERVTAADLCYELLATEHLGNEFIAGEQDCQATRIVVINLVGHQPESRQPELVFQFHTTIILRFSRSIGRRRYSASRSRLIGNAEPPSVTLPDNPAGGVLIRIT